MSKGLVEGGERDWAEVVRVDGGGYVRSGI